MQKYDQETVDHLYNSFTLDRYLSQPEILYRLQTNLLPYQKSIWEDILSKRRMQGRKTALLDQNGNNLWYVVTPSIDSTIHEIDFRAKDELRRIVSSEIHKNVVFDSLIDEAFYSSVIEGAFSTKKRTRELVDTKDPKNKSERMILNNYNGLLYILENINTSLNVELFLKLHNIITENTLEPDEISEKYRDDLVCIMDENAINTMPIYTAPKDEDVQQMMNSLFTFIGDESTFIHPLIKSCIIHYYIVYVHPFFDGNGRVARAFSYMYLLQQGYDFFTFFSISSVVNQKRKKYYKAIKDSEDFSSDMTYFIKAYLEMTNTSVSEVIEKLVKELNHEILIMNLKNDEIYLNTRQTKILNILKRKDNNLLTIEEYRKRMKVSYETARRDLSELESLGIFKKMKNGKKFIFKYLGTKGYTE
ncbi:Fic family protein [Bacillus sp. DJP31]|uniref:Fic family protein n=1 Tax=Bacillus sp. DJP31 TaxID=3409789 RepID=UPI003BB6DEB3